MGLDISRRQLLRGDIRGERKPLRPPWSAGEACFIEHCTRCNQCISACPTSIITTDTGGFPVIDFYKGECDFCQACADACDTLAIDRQEIIEPWALKASFQDTCLARNAVICRSCSEQCETEAIFFRPRPGGVAIPELDIDTCTGCGACVHACPVQAVHIGEFHDAGKRLQQVNV